MRLQIKLRWKSSSRGSFREL